MTTARTVFHQTQRLLDPNNYPLSMWEQQRARYWEYWRHFDGTWLDETVSETDNTLCYPLKLNPFNMACMPHAGFLFGEVQDSADPLVTAVVEPWGRNSSQEQRDLAARLTDVINRVWAENDGRALQQEAGLISQILGGCVFGASYDPVMEQEGKLPIRIDHVLPEFFFPVPAPTQYWRLLETFVCFEITGRQASLMYAAPPEYDTALYQEWWTGDHYEITVDGQPVTWGGVSMEGVPLGKRGPYTYIPHIRAGEFYGISLLEGKMGLAEEINERMADVGDIVSENARLLPAIVNARKVGITRLGYGTSFINLGQTAPGMDRPEIVYPTGVRPENSVVTWAKDLLNIARTEAYTPPVLYRVGACPQSPT